MVGLESWGAKALQALICCAHMLTSRQRSHGVQRLQALQQQRLLQLQNHKSRHRTP